MEIFYVSCIVLAFVGKSFSLDNGLGRVPALGWNTWCTLGRCERDYCDAKEIMSIADAMATNGMKELGYEYINLDDCWADHREADGTIVPDKDRFPEGLVPVIKYVNSKGFKFGLYTDGGIYTCSQGGRPHKIPGSYGHYEQDAQTYADWGVEYVKMDWCDSKINGTQLDPKVQYALMSKALNKTGKPIFFNSCEWGEEDPWEWMSQFANSWRSGPDHYDDWYSTAIIIEVNADKGKYAGPGGWNDADFLMTGGQGCKDNKPMIHCPGMTDTEYRTEFSLWSIISSSLIVATDVRNMTDIMKEVLLNAEVIAVSQDKLGKGGSRIGFSTSDTCHEHICQIWAKELSDGYTSVVLYNAGEKTEKITLEFSMLNMSGSVSMRDLWAHKDLGIFTDSFSVSVESHGVAMYKVKKAD